WLACRRQGIDTLVVPVANHTEAQAVEGLRVLAAPTLRDAVGLLNGDAATAPEPPAAPASDDLDFADVRGQAYAKRALGRAGGGGEVDFEVGEWLDGRQMAEAKRYERLEAWMLDSIGPQAPNTSPHFRAVMLTPREDAPAGTAADCDGFGADIWALVRETDRRG